MKEQICLQKALQSEYLRVRSKNPLVSVRAFSRKLGFNSGIISSIMNGKRRVSSKMARRLVDAMNLDPARRSEVLRHFSSPISASPSEDCLQLSADSYHTVSEWYHFAILSLVKTKGFQPDAAWISRRLGISMIDTSRALDRLERLKLLIPLKAGSKIVGYRRTSTRIQTTDDVRSAALRRSHGDSLELAQKSLDHDDLAVRDFSAMTLTMNIKKIPEAKELIRKFHAEMSELVETPNAKEVYKVCVQLFPLTKIEVTHD